LETNDRFTSKESVRRSHIEVSRQAATPVIKINRSMFLNRSSHQITVNFDYNVIYWKSQQLHTKIFQEFCKLQMGKNGI